MVNLSINTGIVGRKPDKLGKLFSKYWERAMDGRILWDYFDDPMYQHNDEPYAGLAYQQAYKECGKALPEKAHALGVEDYMLTIGAIPAYFYRKPGPIIKWANTDVEVVRPAIIHWVTATQYLYYRILLWKGIVQLGM